MDLLFPLLILFMIGMIFFSNRQRKKQQQQQEDLQNAIQIGDVVVMTSGISGTVVDTDDERTIDLEIAPDVITTWLRAAVREKLSSEADGEHTPSELDEHDDDLVDTPASAVTSPSAPSSASTPAVTSPSVPGTADPVDTPRATADTTGNGVPASTPASGETRSS